jgi:hypothetical protein
MGFGVGIILIATGAILAWAVEVDTTGFNINTAGYILLVVGIVAVLASLIFWSSWAGPGYFSRRGAVDDGGPRRRTVVEDDV